jgi:predicted nucleic acid-binding protein
VILVDSSAWVGFLRGTGSPARLRLRSALQGKDELACRDAIAMEILAGARDDADRDRCAELLCEAADFTTIARHAPLRLVAVA